MPINCPHGFEICDSICSCYQGDACGYFFPPMPFKELLTVEERLDWIEKPDKPLSRIDEKHILREHQDAIHRAKVLLLDLQTKVNKHIDKEEDVYE